MFDCVMPTRAGRHGLAYTRFGRVNLRNAKHAEDSRPLDPESSCAAARDYSRAYLHHLAKSGEILAMMLLTAVNLAYYQDLMAALREAISAEVSTISPRRRGIHGRTRDWRDDAGARGFDCARSDAMPPAKQSKDRPEIDTLLVQFPRLEPSRRRCLRSRLRTIIACGSGTASSRDLAWISSRLAATASYVREKL